MQKRKILTLQAAACIQIKLKQYVQIVINSIERCQHIYLNWND